MNPLSGKERGRGEVFIGLASIAFRRG